MKIYKILVVDDGIENLKAIISIIEKHHPEYLVYQANNGTIALNVIERYMPDIVLSDWEMPVLNGIELTRILKNEPHTKHIPVIIVSGVMISADDLKVAIEAGAVDYIRKPVNPTELLARMHAAITIAEYHKKLIREKESKILENVIFTNEVNSFLSKLSANIKDLVSKFGDVNELKRETSEIVLDITKKIKGDSWQKYSAEFSNLHPEYKKRLLNIHPSLSPADLNLCSMIRLGLSIKELAGLMFVTVESMRVSRSRLRKKLDLDLEQNLQAYLSSV